MEKQKGNALFLILIAVALFAALSYAVTNSGRGGSGIDKEQASIASSEIVAYAGLATATVERLKLYGCADNEISFERSPFDGSDTVYFNANSPADFSCHVFHPSAGGLDDKYHHISALPAMEVGEIRLNFSGASDLLGIGEHTCGGNSDCSDLYMAFRFNGPGLANTCESLNQNFGHADLLPLFDTVYM